MLAKARHEDGLRRSVEQFLLKSDRSGEALVRALLPPPQRHRVACVSMALTRSCASTTCALT